MSEVDFSLFSMLKEGLLRRNGSGRWFLEIQGEGLVPLDTLLEPYKNRKVRMTCVDIRKADAVSVQLQNTSEGVTS